MGCARRSLFPAYSGGLWGLAARSGLRPWVSAPGRKRLVGDAPGLGDALALAAKPAQRRRFAWRNLEGRALALAKPFNRNASGVGSAGPPKRASAGCGHPEGPPPQPVWGRAQMPYPAENWPAPIPGGVGRAARVQVRTFAVSARRPTREETADKMPPARPSGHARRTGMPGGAVHGNGRRNRFRDCPPPLFLTGPRAPLTRLTLVSHSSSPSNMLGVESIFRARRVAGRGRCSVRVWCCASHTSGCCAWCIRHRAV